MERKTEIRMAGPGIEPGSSRMRVQKNSMGADGRQTGSRIVTIEFKLTVQSAHEGSTLKDEVDRSRWLRTTNLPLPTLNYFPANKASKNGVGPFIPGHRVTQHLFTMVPAHENSTAGALHLIYFLAISKSKLTTLAGGYKTLVIYGIFRKQPTSPYTRPTGRTCMLVTPGSALRRPTDGVARNQYLRVQRMNPSESPALMCHLGRVCALRVLTEVPALTDVDCTQLLRALQAREPSTGKSDNGWRFKYIVASTRRGREIGLLASHQGEPGSIPGRGSLPDFLMRESCRTMPLVSGFSRGSSIPPTHSFRRFSILTSITLIESQDLAIKEWIIWFVQLSTFPAWLGNYLFLHLADLNACSHPAQPHGEGNASCGDLSVGFLFRHPLRPELRTLALFAPFWGISSPDPNQILRQQDSNSGQKRCHGGVEVRLLASHLDDRVRLPAGSHQDFREWGTVPDDSTGRCVFSGVFCFPLLLHSALLHTHLTSPSRALEDLKIIGNRRGERGEGGMKEDGRSESGEKGGGENGRHEARLISSPVANICVHTSAPIFQEYLGMSPTSIVCLQQCEETGNRLNSPTGRFVVNLIRFGDKNVRIHSRVMKPAAEGLDIRPFQGGGWGENGFWGMVEQGSGVKLAFQPSILMGTLTVFRIRVGGGRSGKGHSAQSIGKLHRCLVEDSDEFNGVWPEEVVDGASVCDSLEETDGTARTDDFGLVCDADGVVGDPLEEFDVVDHNGFGIFEDIIDA
ncbi:hypothetical protein PR048_031697 [Dryococelus australis]|uniref:Uncharacterized protein n=1 Tax=Dryococelus australis TaxID=614101 RepID=A0ABQ9G605_9NEOP|nr:hypothetical protein PR048_031697 [Dryococelus australis]